ncbi:ribosome small subunit-dependent GTPase A [Telmatocola sphagniphila]|jgi:ribosome biogenesis GTPase|uniref:Small ribosomal subunit biogenesis GTPase RsgA n=1 Tax=Telmatocola sphagniphila TaxID=1123043 RepID=A0A8E6B6A2_9BACT|nr:ribosome small subunit-dependent GTPase A [Telmatocola sphagniphila]QVL31190.1 ribosome small subunit-dependent GTPase A [Telmatocola sphagniphila]
MGKKKKVRVELRKNRSKPPRDHSWTKGFGEHGFEELAPLSDERVRPKGELSRHRTIIQEHSAVRSAEMEMPTVSMDGCLHGRVLRVHGLQSVVQTLDGAIYRCTVRRLLKSLVTDERSVVTCGDRVWFRPAADNEGMIEVVDPRHGILTRESRRREHVLVANVDQVVIVLSLVEPDLKPHLIDRYLASARQGSLKPIIVLNKSDLAETVPLQSLIGAYSQLGITTLLTSAKTGQGIERLRRFLANRSSVFSGQSGVGKSSLLNAIQDGLTLRVSHVSDVNQKGRHTTTTAELIPLQFGGWVVDTPGIRQMQIWDVRPEEVEGFFVEFHPLVPLCGFPDCMHTHEENCAVKKAVDQGLIGSRRYHSYIGMFEEAKGKVKHA